MIDFKQFGGKVTKELINKYANSKNFKEGSFSNKAISDKKVSIKKKEMLGIAMKQLKSWAGKAPSKPLPIEPFDATKFSDDSNKFIWYGHSAILMRFGGKNILIDPMFGPNATPIISTPTKRFSENTLDLIDKFPPIDLVLISHDHYDCLDYDSIQKLKNKTTKFWVALGVGRHLAAWGINANSIVEFDWWVEKDLGGVKVTFIPSLHFSGRGLTDGNKTLWGGWALKASGKTIWFSGNGGYDKHFKEIGKKLGKIDFAFMACGQYNDKWKPMNLFPKESVQASMDAKVKKAMPVHWSGFALSYQHSWTEPVKEFVEEAKGKKLDYITPKLGQIFNIESTFKNDWWSN